MKVVPIVGAHSVTPQTTAPDSRAKAIAAFNKSAQPAAAPQAQEHPVANPNQVSPEELSAIQSPKSDNSTITEDTQPQVAEVTEETPAAPVESAQSKQFAQLARQERALRAKAQQQEQAYKAREAALNAREAALAAEADKYKQGYISKDRVKADTLAALAEAGVTYDEVTNQMLTQVPTDPRMVAHIQRLEAKLQAMEEASQNTVKAQTEQQQQQYQAAIKQITMDTKSLIKADPDSYEVIATTGSVQDVVDLIEQTYAKDGVLLSVEEAANEVENYLIEEGLKIAQLKKIQARREQSNASKAPGAKQTPATSTQTQASMKTLTNATGSTRKLSSKERAILAFNGELKK